MRTRTLLLPVVVLALPALAAGKKGPPCDPKKIAELKKTLPKEDIKTWTNTVADALAASCAELPKSVADALADFDHSERHDHAAAIILAFRDAAPFANAGCKDWQTKIDAAGAMAPGDKLRKIYKDCEVAKTKLMTEDEFVMVPDLGAAWTAAPLNTWLTKNGMDAATAKTLVRWLCAVPDAKKPEKVEKDTKKKK